MSRKFDTFVIVSQNKTHHVQVMFRKGNSPDDPGSFSATFQVAPDQPESRLGHTDLHQLYKLVKAEFDKYVVIDWKPKIHIEVDGRNHIEPGTTDRGDNWEATLKLEYTFVELGVDPNGKNVHRAGPGGKIGNNWPHVGPKQQRSYIHTDALMSSLIDDTPQHREALKNIFDAFDVLRKRLMDLIDPVQIQQTLSQASNGVKLIASQSLTATERKGS